MIPEEVVVMAAARTRVWELRNVARALWPDRDDAAVMSELVAILSDLRAAEAVLRSLVDGRAGAPR